MPALCTFPCPKVTFRRSPKKKSKCFFYIFCLNREDCRRKWGKELPVPVVDHSCYGSRGKQRIAGLWRPLNRPLLLSRYRNGHSRVQTTSSTHYRKEERTRRHTRTVRRTLPTSFLRRYGQTSPSEFVHLGSLDTQLMKSQVKTNNNISCSVFHTSTTDESASSFLISSVYLTHGVLTV